MMKKKYVILSVLTSLCIVLDQVTKYWVHGHFRLGESIPIWSGFFNLTYVRNTGAAFGILAQADPSFRVPFFLIVPMTALVAIGYIFKKLPDSDVRMSVALSLVIGGAVGNLADRLFLGFVVDFLDFHWKYRYHFPAFNVADIAIFIGVALLMLDLFVQEPKEAGRKNVSSSR